MFFKLLKLAGIDVNAKIAELKGDLEFKAQQVSEHASFKARNLALIAGLFLCASIFLLFALIVGLVALYHWAELHYGPNTGLGLVAGTLLILAALCVGVALSYTNSRPDELPLRRIVFSSPPARRAQSTPSGSGIGTAHRFDSASTYQSTPFKGEDLVEPLLVLLGPYLRSPATGHPPIDNFLSQIGTKAEGTTNEAVGRAADLVRNGNRATMLSVLGAATLFGWLIARGATNSHSARG
jgi:hypothetical protein